MKSTHWSVTDNPEHWHDDPATDPITAARDFITGETAQDDAWDQRNELMDGDTVTLTVHGWRETTDLLDPEVAFDGYEPAYFAPTKDTVTIRVRLEFEVQS